MVNLLSSEIVVSVSQPIGSKIRKPQPLERPRASLGELSGSLGGMQVDVSMESMLQSYCCACLLSHRASESFGISWTLDAIRSAASRRDLLVGWAKDKLQQVTSGRPESQGLWWVWSVLKLFFAVSHGTVWKRSWKRLLILCKLSHAGDRFQLL